MKKIAITFCFLTLLAAPIAVYAQRNTGFAIARNETSMSAGFEFGNSIIHNPDNSYLGAPGMTLEGYSFRNGRKFGTFLHSAFLFPVIGDESRDLQWDAIVGPASRVVLTDKLTLQTGLGLSLTGMYGRYEDAELDKDLTRSMFTLGIGADAGLKFDINDRFFFKGGVNIAWSIFGWTNVREGDGWTGDRGKTERNPRGNWELNVNPYITFGINIYSERQRIERTRLGKPPAP
jgi:hypothetical protein